jgi:hypothetical protein
LHDSLEIDVLSERERGREGGQGSKKLEDFSLFVLDDRLAFHKEI